MNEEQLKLIAAFKQANIEDEIQFEGRDGRRTLKILFAFFSGQGDNRWRVWEGPRLIASANTRGDVIEKAKLAVLERTR